MARTRRTFASLSPRAQRRAYVAGARFELSERSVRERYNRGTWNPFARRDPEKRVPAEWRRYAEETAPGQVEVNWGNAAYARMRQVFGPESPYGERLKFNVDSVRYRMQVIASDDMARIIAQASEEELEAWAHIREGEPDLQIWGLPEDVTLNDISYSRDGEWYSIFWYH